MVMLFPRCPGSLVRGRLDLWTFSSAPTDASSLSSRNAYSHRTSLLVALTTRYLRSSSSLSARPSFAISFFPPPGRARGSRFRGLASSATTAQLPGQFTLRADAKVFPKTWGRRRRPGCCDAALLRYITRRSFALRNSFSFSPHQPTPTRSRGLPREPTNLVAHHILNRTRLVP